MANFWRFFKLMTPKNDEFSEPRFPHETPARFDFLEAMLSNDTVTTDFLPASEERVIYVRVAFRLGVTTTTYDITQIGEATMFSPNCRLDFISLYPRPVRIFKKAMAKMMK